MSPAELTLKARLDRKGFVLDVDIRLPGRGITALFGPSGSGKTSCLRVLAGLERSAHGHVQIGDQVWQDSAAGLFVPTAPSAGPWLSPQVVKRRTRPKLLKLIAYPIRPNAGA